MCSIYPPRRLYYLQIEKGILCDMETTKKRYKAVIVGTGGIAGAHVQGLRHVAERVELAAACDIDPNRLDAFCSQHGIKGRYTDANEMLKQEKPDIVHICTPPSLHAPLAITSVEAGAHVLCEKPLCASLAEFDQIAAAEERTGRYVSSVFQHRFGSGAQHLRALIDAKAMGRLLVAQCNTTWYRDHAYFAVPWRGKWSTELGGPTMGHGIHQMDLLLWLLGDWEEVQAMAGTLDRHIEVEDVSMALVRFKNGAMVTIVNSVLSPREESYLRFDFQKATVELSHLYGYGNDNWSFTKVRDVDDATFAEWSTIKGNINSGHHAQIAALLDSLDRGERPLVSGHEARRTIEFLTALYKAAFTRSPVTQGSIVPGDPFYAAIHGGYTMDAFRMVH